MTLDEALELARVVQAKPHLPWGKERIDAQALARFVLDTLGAQMPCGFDEPRVVSDPIGQPDTPPWVEFAATNYEPDEAIAIGAALVRAGLVAKGGRP